MEIIPRRETKVLNIFLLLVNNLTWLFIWGLCLCFVRLLFAAMVCKICSGRVLSLTFVIRENGNKDLYMRGLAKIFLAGMIGFLIAGQAFGQPTGRAMTFVASTPCTSGTKPLPGMADEKCELMMWKLQLVSGSQNRPGTYILDCDYGLPLQGTKRLINGGKHLHREGKWTVVNGAKTIPLATIYRLDPDQPKASVSFIKLSDDVIHLLDSDMQLMIGNGGGGYTLNKVTQ